LAGCDLVILGTLNAFTQQGQSALARAILATGIPTVIVAMRLPYDLAAVPEAKTYLCTYSILEPSIRVLTRALFDPARIHGRLPVTIPGLYPRGFGIAG
jgi:beta-N-acetylhexosaminidase